MNVIDALTERILKKFPKDRDERFEFSSDTLQKSEEVRIVEALEKSGLIIVGLRTIGYVYARSV